MTFKASNGIEITTDKSWPLHDGTMVRYYSANGWSFSSLEDEDNNVEYAKQAIAAWQAWLEFLESGQIETD